MTREEQIEEWVCNTGLGGDEYAKGFIAGAIKADANPIPNRLFDQSKALNHLEAMLAIALEALEYVINREDFSFAECSEAEEIWKRCKGALLKIEGMKNEG